MFYEVIGTKYKKNSKMIGSIGESDGKVTTNKKGDAIILVIFEFGEYYMRPHDVELVQNVFKLKRGFL